MKQIIEFIENMSIDKMLYFFILLIILIVTCSKALVYICKEISNIIYKHRNQPKKNETNNRATQQVPGSDE